MRIVVTFPRGQVRGCTGCHETWDRAPLRTQRKGVSPDGQTVWVTLEGVHEIEFLDRGLLMQYLSGEFFPRHPKPSDAKACLAWGVRDAIGKNPIERHRPQKLRFYPSQPAVLLTYRLQRRWKPRKGI